MLDTPQKRETAIKLGVRAGYLLCAVVPIQCTLLFITLYYSLQQNLFAQALDALFSAVDVIAYIVLLFGVEAVAVEIGSAQFRRSIRLFTTIIAMSLPIFVVAPFLEASILASSIHTVLLLVFCVLSGIASIRIASSMRGLAALHGTGYHHAQRWLRISGWLMVTVVLLPLGALLSLVADYFLWRIVRAQVAFVASTAVPVLAQEQTPEA